MRTLKLVSAFLGASILWVLLAVILAFYGWWMSPVAPLGDHDAFAAWAEKELHTHNVGVSTMAVISSGRLRSDFFAPESTNQDTLFPTASFSKFVTALSVMSLVEAGRIDLDEPVEHYLSRWQFPDSEFDHNQVSIRRLLSHTAGLTDGLGFGDYMPEETVPDLVSNLVAPRASTGVTSIRVGVEPGREYLYSGGGYLVLQLLIEEVTGLSFAQYVQTAILNPLQMTRSTYEYIGELENTAPSYERDGSVAPRYRYASDAATGFNSTTADLSRLAIAILNEMSPLHPDTIGVMHTPEAFNAGAPIWGLGTILYAPVADGGYVFGHDGGNDPALNSTMRLNPETRDGIIVFTSGHPSLASRIGSEWVFSQTGTPDILAIRQVLRSALLPVVIGVTLILCGVLVFARRRKQLW